MFARILPQVGNKPLRISSPFKQLVRSGVRVPLLLEPREARKGARQRKSSARDLVPAPMFDNRLRRHLRRRQLARRGALSRLGVEVDLRYEAQGPLVLGEGVSGGIERVDARRGTMLIAC